jgi:hypothetical protein
MYRSMYKKAHTPCYSGPEEASIALNDFIVDLAGLKVRLARQVSLDCAKKVASARDGGYARPGNATDLGTGTVSAGQTLHEYTGDPAWTLSASAADRVERYWHCGDLARTLLLVEDA